MKNQSLSSYYLSFILLFLFSMHASCAENEKAFSEAQLDQMMAPIALYPDSLLSQILMACTYPDNIAEAVAWSKANSSQKGDAAVTAVQDKPWDPSVMSLVAFPQVLEMMGKKPDWVKNLGDAFLATPDKVMDSAQKLRKKAKQEGNLKTSEQQKVSVDTTSQQTIVIIEPADPKTVYVPVYNPTVIYGTWWWPHYMPYYYYPPPRYGYGVGIGIAFGIAIVARRSLWGGCHWRSGSVNINVNRYNNININNKISGNGKGSSNWKHNSNNRGSTPYRDKNTANKYNKNRSGVKDRQSFRGRDKTSSQRNSQRNIERKKAQDVLKNRGADPVAGRNKLSGKSGDKIRNQTNKINRQNLSGSNKIKRSSTSSLKNRSNRSNSNALSGVRNSNRSSSRNFNRGSVSRSNFRSGGGFGGGGGRRGGGRR